MRLWLSAALLLAFAAPALAGEDFTPEPGFKSLFNGKDLTGWRLKTESLDGKAESSDHRFQVKDGVLVITGGKSMKEVEEIDTSAEHNGDFVLRFEFRASPSANSGLHLRDHDFKHQLQIRDYKRVGPYKDLKSYKDGDWNSIEVVVKNDPSGKSAVARCTCNGDVIEEALALPGKGPIGLQSETNVLEYRRIRIKE